MILTRLLFALWGSKPVRYAVAGLVALGAYQGWKHHQREIGATEVVTTINDQAEKQAEKAVAAREPAKLPGAALRLKSNWCRDCTK